MALAPAAAARAAPARVKFTKDEMLDAARKSPEYGALVTEAVAAGMNAPAVDQLGQLLIHSLRLTDSTGEIASKDLIKLLKSCGLSSRAAKAKVCRALVNARDSLNLDHADNAFFRKVGVAGRLDQTHISSVMVKRDGITETLQSGDDAVSIRARQVGGGLLRIIEAQLDKAKRYEAEHKQEELQRLASYAVLEQCVQTAMGCSTLSARGRCRQFAASKYDALGFVNPALPGFTTAKTALASVAKPHQLMRRQSDAVADNLTREGKFADGYINGAVARDIQNRAAEINVAPTQAAKKRLMNNAMNERVSRIKRFHMFAEDPAMIGVDAEAVGSQFVATKQANTFLNQEADKNNFQ